MQDYKNLERFGICMDGRETVSTKNSDDLLHIGFKSFGVEITVSTNNAELFAVLEKSIEVMLPNEFVRTNAENSAHNFYVEKTTDKFYKLFKYFGTEKEEFLVKTDDPDMLLSMLDTELRITVAEYASEKVFLHAGAVGYKGCGIIIPGKSFLGKTTLVASLIRKGAEYYSDEYAVLDKDGYLHPFHKLLSMRGIIDDFTQKDISFEEFGGVAGIVPLPIRLILLAEYKAGKVEPEQFEPEIISKGNGMLEIISNTIPIRFNTKFTLEVLNKTVNRAIIAKSIRGDADVFADLLLNYVEKEII